GPRLSFLPLGVWGGRAGPPVLEASSANAKRLLADAGLARGTSVSLLIGDDGKRGDQSRIAEAIRASLAPAGISVPIQTESPEVALRIARNAQHQIALIEATVEAGDTPILPHPPPPLDG